MSAYEATTFEVPEGTTVTTVTATKKANPIVAGLKKILPWVAIGVGLLLLAMVLRPYVWPSSTGASVTPAPLADPNYGTSTLSGIPYYDQYQNKYPATEQALKVAADASAGRSVPVGCEPTCQGLVGCTDSGAYNFNPTATCGCISCCVPRTFGCLDPKATTFNPFANTNDARFCKYAVAAAPARLPPTALSVAPLVSAGCTDIQNAMFDPTATFNDGSCVYGGQLVLPAQATLLNGGCPLQLGAGTGANLGCLAPRDTQFLGGFKGCGDAWDLRKGNSLGATMY